MKCATTRTTRYAIENNAITLVYFKESRRRKKDRGITISLGMSVFRLSRSEHSHSHESSDPELPIDKETDISSTGCEADHNPRHQVSDNDEIADCHPKALDGDSGIE
jgi:hypothetical protein